MIIKLVEEIDDSVSSHSNSIIAYYNNPVLNIEAVNI